ncbi:sulfite exporter TauE/SafE family protein [Candidatus Bathyarchaeota archaeon]|nr:MAG: sulfite exporter TauE/SafE family protein [Candidatus Bathyarchaeota archaeon]
MRIFLIELSRVGILKVHATVVLGPVDVLIIFLVSIVAGFIGAMFGLGGGVLIIPFLTLVEGVPVPLAVGASIVSVVATSSASAATYVQDHLTNLRLGMFLEIGTVAGAITGAFVSVFLPASYLFILFGIILLYATIVMIRARGIDFPANVRPDKTSRILALGSQYEDHSLNRVVKYEVTRTPLTVFIGFFAGIVSGLLGVGGGIINVPTMNLVSKIPVKVASATSNFIIGVTAAASASVYLLRGDVHPLLAAPLIIGVAGGALLGTKVLKVTPPTRVKVAFGILLAAISLLMILKGFNLPVVL